VYDARGATAPRPRTHQRQGTLSGTGTPNMKVNN